MGAVVSGHQGGWGVFAQREDHFLRYCLLAEGALQGSLLQWRGDDD